MMIFQLLCEEGHEFEAWFQDSAGFREQMARGLVQCPSCGGCQVRQRLSTGGLMRTRGDGGSPPKEPADILHALRKVIETHFENVGSDFAKTALRIHYGAEEGRNIRGSTTEAEERLLRDEGVDFIKLPLPDPPTDRSLQ